MKRLWKRFCRLLTDERGAWFLFSWGSLSAVVGVGPWLATIIPNSSVLARAQHAHERVKLITAPVSNA